MQMSWWNMLANFTNYIKLLELSILVCANIKSTQLINGLKFSITPLVKMCWMILWRQFLYLLIIDKLTNDLGKLFPLVNGILKIRSGPHQVFTHYSELVRLHGHTLANEAFCEYAHQEMKRQARNATRIPSKGGKRITTLPKTWHS